MHISKYSPLKSTTVPVCTVILVIAISVGCLDLDGNYDGHWQGHAVFCGTESCSYHDPHDSSAAVEMDLVQLGHVLTGVFRLEGVIDSAEMTGLDADRNGFELVGQSSCAELSGYFYYPEGIEGSVTVEWARCDRDGTEVWSMMLNHTRGQ